MSNTHREFMGKENITSLLWKFSLPATIGMLVNALYNIVDRIFVGNSPEIGANGLAAITIVFPIVMILMAIALMCGVGGSTLFSISLGEKKYERAQKIIGNAFALSVITAIIVSIFTFVFMDSILIAFGASKTVLPLARTYLSIILLGAIFQSINMTGNNLIRADGSPKIAMLSIILGAIINTILNPIYIFVFHWGIAGSAIATITGQLFSTLWILNYFLGNKANFKLKFKNLILDAKLATKIISIGLPAFFIQAAGSILNIFLNANLVTHGGDIAISAMGIVNSVQTLLLMPMIGVNQGALPIIGYNYGADKIDRVRETIKKAAIAATTIALVGWIFVQLFSTSIISVFTSDLQLVELGAKFLRYWFLALPVIGLGMVGANYFQAVGKVMPAIFLTLARQIFILIPLISILSRSFGLFGIVIAAPISDVLSTIITLTLLNISLRRLAITRVVDEKNYDSAL